MTKILYYWLENISIKNRKISKKMSRAYQTR